MATFPHNLCGIRQDGHAEQHAPVVLRSEVERGMPRQRRTSADARVTVPCTLVFRSAAAAAEFEAWYYAEGFGWFDFTLPRTGAVVEARIVGGDIGGLTPITPAWNASERSITIEYRRPGFIQLPPGLHSVNPARILSVQRNSTATYVDDAGVLQTAAANVLRYQGGQVLVEGEATNLQLYSQDLSSGAYANCSRGPSAAFYAGSVPFWYVSKISSGPFEFCEGRRVSVSDGEQIESSCAFLAGSSTVCEVTLYGFGGSQRGDTADATLEVLSGPGYFSVQSGSGGELVNLSATTPTLIRIRRVQRGADGSVALIFYPGGITSTVIGLSIQATRFQLHVGGSSLSYIPTTTAPATRAADVITVAA